MREAQKPLTERFSEKFLPNPESGCWLWTAALSAKGYGQFRHNGAMRPAHRVAYELFVGSIPTGLEIDHKCRVRNCVNPAHLEAVTHLVNIRRGSIATATHCANGHPLSGPNLLIEKVGRGYRARRCRTCRMPQMRAAKLRYKARKAA